MPDRDAGAKGSDLLDDVNRFDRLRHRGGAWISAATVSEEVSMTEKRDLKRLVRERQARTGESYVTALRQVQAQKQPTIAVVELVDLTEIGAPLGYKRRIWCTPTLLAQLDAVATLTRFRDLLLATGRDRNFDLMRDVALRGLTPQAPRARMANTEMVDFLARARAGLGGVSGSGRMVAVNVDAKGASRMVIFALTLGTFLASFGRARDPSLGLSEVPEADTPPFSWQVLPW
jgi:hypothetical protein